MRRRGQGLDYMILGALALMCVMAGVAIGLALRPDSAPAGVEGTGEAAEASLSAADIAARWSGSVAEVVVEYRSGRRQEGTESNGSGVYVDARGFFLTNHHVIEDVLSVRVRLPDGRELPVLDSAYNRTYDVAVLYTGPAENIQPVDMGTSASLRVGDPVIAIGYPRVGGDVLSGTLTAGVVSGLGRLNVTAGNISPDVGMIQIDAPINAGNSGGALFDGRGLLVGVPTMKISSGFGESFEGLAFAIPVDTAWPVARSLIDEVLGEDAG
jgi:S1-C subfamily serine protease